MKRLPGWMSGGACALMLTCAGAQGASRGGRVDPYVGYDSGSAARLERVSRSGHHARVIHARPLGRRGVGRAAHARYRAARRVAGGGDEVRLAHPAQTLATGGTGGVVLHRPGRRIVIGGRPARRRATVVHRPLHVPYRVNRAQGAARTPGATVVRNPVPHGGVVRAAPAPITTTTTTAVIGLGVRPGLRPRPGRAIYYEGRPGVWHSPYPRVRWRGSRHHGFHRRGHRYIHRGHYRWGYQGGLRFRWRHHGRPGVYFHTGFFGGFHTRHTSLIIRLGF